MEAEQDDFKIKIKVSQVELKTNTEAEKDEIKARKINQGGLKDELMLKH